MIKIDRLVLDMMILEMYQTGSYRTKMFVTRAFRLSVEKTYCFRLFFIILDKICVSNFLNTESNIETIMQLSMTRVCKVLDYWFSKEKL